MATAGVLRLAAVGLALVGRQAATVVVVVAGIGALVAGLSEVGAQQHAGFVAAVEALGSVGFVAESVEVAEAARLQSAVVGGIQIWPR